MLWIDHVAGHHYATLGGSLSSLSGFRAEPDHRAVAAPRRHLRRHHRPLLHRRGRGRDADRVEQRRELEHVADRRLRRRRRRLLRRPDRRRPRLRPRPHRRPDPVRSRPAGTPARSASGHDAADRSPALSPRRRARPSDPELERSHGQRRRHEVQRPPLDHPRLHAERGQQDRPTHRDHLHRYRARARRLLLQGLGRGRGG